MASLLGEVHKEIYACERSTKIKERTTPIEATISASDANLDNL
jgi:hypothetical protein